MTGVIFSLLAFGLFLFTRHLILQTDERHSRVQRAGPETRPCLLVYLQCTVAAWVGVAVRFRRDWLGVKPKPGSEQGFGTTGSNKCLDGSYRCSATLRSWPNVGDPVLFRLRVVASGKKEGDRRPSFSNFGARK